MPFVKRAHCRHKTNNRLVEVITLRRAPISELRELAMQQGMRTLMQDALEKAMRGITDVKQARSIAVK